MPRRLSCSFAPSCLAIAFVLGLSAGGCAESEAFRCINDGDCPPACSCDNSALTLITGCESNASPGRDCGGTCDAETACGEGRSCQFARTEDNVDLYECQADGSGGAGGNGGAGGSGGSRSIIDRCAESDSVYCNNGYDCRERGWSVSAEVFDDFYGQSLDDCLTSSRPCTTEDQYCPDRGGGTYSADNHEACIRESRTTNCAVDELDLPVFPPICDEICIM